MYTSKQELDTEILKLELQLKDIYKQLDENFKHPNFRLGVHLRSLRSLKEEKLEELKELREKLEKDSFICGLCGHTVRVSKHNDRDWACIACSNPNCLSPSTGWNKEAMVKSKWLKYFPRHN